MKKVFTEKQIPEIAQSVLDLIIGAEHQGRSAALVVALYGDLGAGKTTLTKEIARKLGIKENVNSPTFVLIKSYHISPIIKYQAFSTFFHIDAYRLNSEEELLKLGWQEVVSDPTNIIFIEWPERVKILIPKDAIKIYLDHKGKQRSIDIKR